MKKILIADDEAINKIIMKEALSKYGLCDIVSDGLAAVEAYNKSLLNNDPFDLICLDIMMPELDGQGALLQIREMEKQSGLTGSNASKVIMITALDDPKNIMQAMVKGECNGYLTKPIDLDELDNLLTELGFVAQS